MRKTVKVIFPTKFYDNIEKLKESTLKKYAFNFKKEVKVGDFVEIKGYMNYAQVIQILPTKYNYYSESGNLYQDYFDSALKSILTVNIEIKKSIEERVVENFKQY